MEPYNTKERFTNSRHFTKSFEKEVVNYAHKTIEYCSKISETVLKKLRRVRGQRQNFQNLRITKEKIVVFKEKIIKKM